MNTRSIVLANFGGPRNKEEIGSFLSCLLTDPLITGNYLPKKLHHLLFNFIAKIRTKKTTSQYEKIGGYSPIFSLTETLALIISQLIRCRVITFHRYLPSTHCKTLSLIKKACLEGNILVVPLFPHYTHSVTGSMASFFSQNLSQKELSRISWIKSFGDHYEFIESMSLLIQNYIKINGINYKDLGLIFSAHGLPKKHILKGDPYYEECLTSFSKLEKKLTPIPCKLSFQSKFGLLPWLKPYTKTLCKKIHHIMPTQTKIGVVPFGFLSDHIETLFEIEEYYLPIIRSQNKIALRLPALNLRPYWISKFIKIMQTSKYFSTNEIINN